MSGPSPRNLFYRVLPNGNGWYWEIVDAEHVIARGIAEDRVKARSDAIQAAYDRLATIPEPYPGGKSWPDISSV